MYYQKYYLHMKNGDVIEHNEPMDLEPGIVSMWNDQFVKNKMTGAVTLATEVGDHAYFTWDQVCWIEAVEVFKM